MKSSLKVLFIEDCPDDIDLMFIEFQKKGLSVEWKRVETRKELIQELDNNWDIIISDYVLPGFSGPEAIKIIRERFELLPIIIVSGTVGEDIAVDTLKMGATDYLMKSNLRRLVPLIERAVAEYKIKIENKNSELAIKGKQERIESIFRASPIGIGVVVNRVLTEVNNTLCNMLGYAEDELLNKNSRVFYLNKEDYEFIGLDKYKQIAEKGTGTLETQWRCKNGEILEILLSSTPIDQNDLNKGVTFTALDITERKKAERDLAKSETKFRLLADHTYDWEYWINPKGKYTYISPSCEKVSGYSVQKFYKDSDFLVEIVHPDFKDQAHKHFDDEYEQRGDLTSLEFKIIDKAGNEKWIEHVCRPVFDDKNIFLGRRATNRDITKSKHSELLQQIIFNISNAANTATGLDELINVIKDELNQIIDVENFYVAFYNEEDDTFTSPYMLDENDSFKTWPAGKSFTAYVLKSQKPKLLTKDLAKELLESGEIEIVGTLPEVWLGVPLKIKGKTFGVFAVQHYANKDAYTKNDMEMLEFVSHQMSISIERKKAEEELKIAYEKAMESDRLKSAFLATMSHELRTPLNAIIGFSDLIKEKKSLDKILNFAGIINRSGRHLLEIVEDIFDVTLLEVGQFNFVKKSTPLAEIMQTVTELVQAEKVKIKSKVKLIYKPTKDEKEIFINTDKSKLRQILINLLKNALKFTHEGTVEYGYKKINKNGSSDIQFYVKDTGIGIAKDKQEFIFNIFRQVDETFTRNYGGTGIGLFVVKKFTEILGGKLDLESELDKGSTFYVTIPNFTDEIVKEEKENIIEYCFADKTILIVEDDDVSTQLLIEMITDWGANYLTAKNGKEAVQICNDNPTIELVLMDIKMPGMDGYDATSLIKKENENIVIVAQTAHAIVGDKEKALIIISQNQLRPTNC
jgi:PAS domain S-box-containing protein